MKEIVIKENKGVIGDFVDTSRGKRSTPFLSLSDSLVGSSVSITYRQTLSFRPEGLGLRCVKDTVISGKSVHTIKRILNLGIR